MTVVAYFLFTRAPWTASTLHHSSQDFPERPSVDPIFNIDLTMEDMMARMRYRGLPASLVRFRKYGSTYQLAKWFKPTIHTMDMINIQSVWGSRWNEWGIQPSRLPAMAPFCGKGFITTDGPVWQRSKALLAPSFRGSNKYIHESFQTAVTDFLDKLPSDGETVDLQPLFSLMVNSSRLEG